MPPLPKTWVTLYFPSDLPAQSSNGFPDWLGGTTFGTVSCEINAVSSNAGFRVGSLAGGGDATSFSSAPLMYVLPSKSDLCRWAPSNYMETKNLSELVTIVVRGSETSSLYNGTEPSPLFCGTLVDAKSRDTGNAVEQMRARWIAVQSTIF
ncbi:MAG: hypothetical protein WDZ59_03345 [Pirellulales bacterium]